MSTTGPFNANSNMLIPQGYNHSDYYKKAACFILDRHNAQYQNCSRMLTLLPFYFSYSELLGINPLIPICQTLNENTFLSFYWTSDPNNREIVNTPNDPRNPNNPDHLLDESFKNTAGIKKSSEEIAKYIHETVKHLTPKSEYTKEDCYSLDTVVDREDHVISDFEPGCHMTFTNWCESIMAQIQHLAHYSDMYNDARFGDFDPRADEIQTHMPNISISAFCNAYSTTSYANKIIEQMNQILDEPNFHGESDSNDDNQDHSTQTLDEKYAATLNLIDEECLGDLENIREVSTMFGQFYTIGTSFNATSAPYTYLDAIDYVDNHSTENLCVFDMIGNPVYPCIDTARQHTLDEVIADLRDVKNICDERRIP